MNKATSIFAAVASLLLGVAMPAIANYSAIHKATENGKTKVYLPGTPGSQIKYWTDAAPAPRLLSVNDCGWVKLPNYASGVTVNVTGTNITDPGLTDPLYGGTTRSSAPVCLYNAATATYSQPAAETNYATGKAWKHGTDNWFKVVPDAPSPTAVTSEPYVAMVTYNKQYTVNIKQCGANGYGYVTVSTFRPMTIFKIEETTHELAQLPATNQAMICKTIGSSKVLYLPQSGF